MCKAENVIHNLYRQHHTIEKFDVEVEEHKTPSSLQHLLHKPSLLGSILEKVVDTVCHFHYHTNTGIVETIYDIRTVKVHYGSMCYKKQKLADISMPPYIDLEKYLYIIRHLQDFFNDKKMTINHINDEYIYIYYNGECVNNMINNMIVFSLTHN